MDLLRFLLVCVKVASVYTALLSEVHKFIDAHFRNHCYGIDFHFCEFEDAVAHLKFSKNRTLFNKRVKVMKTMDKDELLAKKFPHRASVFVDASCDEGLQLLSTNSEKMGVTYRWLIFTEDMSSVYQTLRSSRLQVDSDVTLITKPNNRSLTYSRLSRMYSKTNFSLSANYSLQETMRNETISQGFFWRGEQITFDNYSFTAVVVFLQSKYYKIEDWPKLLNKSLEPGVEDIRKYFSAVIWYLLEMYNFTLTITNSKDWGQQLPNGSFTGAFGMVERGDVVFGFTGTRPELYRVKNMDFTFSTIDSRFNFVLIQPKTFGTAAALIVPFGTSTWIAFILLVLILIAFMRISALSDKDQVHNDSWGGCLLLVSAGISQNGIPDIASKFSSRTIYLVTLLSLFMLFLYYSTAILNGLILPTPDPIQNIEQLIASNTELGGHDVLYIRRALMINDSITLRARKKMIPNPLLPVDQGIRMVRKGGFAFYGLDGILRNAMKEQYTEDERCLITEIQMIRGFTLCYFLKKNGPYREILNRGILLMRERGILDYLQKYWLVQKPKCITSLLFAPIRAPGMTLAYGVFAAGVICCIIIGVLELLIAKKLKKQTQALPFKS